MKLSEYLKTHSMTQKEFAEKVNISRPQITRIINGSNYPSAKLIGRILDATNGDVSYEDLLKRGKCSD